MDTPGHALRKCHVSAKVRYTSDSVFPTLTCASDVSKDQGKGAHLLADPATKEKKMIGELWENASGGKGLYLMAVKDDGGKDLRTQLADKVAKGR